MGTATAVLRDYSSRELRRLATRVKDARQARRLRAISRLSPLRSVLLCTLGHVRRLVHLHQTFVRRCQERDPDHTGIRAGRGPLALRCGVDKPHRRAELR